MTIDKTTWGFSRLSNINNYYTSIELIQELVKTVSCGGNLLINVGPRADGTIDSIFQDRLLKLGEWLNLNGDSIYETKPFKIQNDTLTQDVWYTCKRDIVYTIFNDWPDNDQLVLSIHNYIDLNEYRVSLLTKQGSNHLKFKVKNDETIINLQKNDLLKTIRPWVVKFEHKN